MTITPDSKVGEIAAQHPMATQVFARHGIDFCCGGGIPLEQACSRRGLETPRILDEIDQVLAARAGDAGTEAGPGAEMEQWTDAPLADLIRHIVHTYHLPLREELPRLESMLRKVHRVHGDKDPERLARLLSTFLGLQAELIDHMRREEDVLFPWILQQGEGAVVPVTPFVDDHTEAGQALATIRDLTDEYQVPDAACNTWRALWHGLEALEQSLHQHIHLENNILFRRVNGM